MSDQQPTRANSASNAEAQMAERFADEEPAEAKPRAHGEAHVDATTAARERRLELIREIYKESHLRSEPGPAWAHDLSDPTRVSLAVAAMVLAMETRWDTVHSGLTD